LQVETLPQSMVDVKTIVLKPRLDPGDIHSMGDKVKPRLFSKFGFKPKPEDIRLVASELYFEPYFIIGGKYVLEYCRKHVLEAELDKRTTKLFVAGQEFNTKLSHSKARGRYVELMGEEHVHYEKQGCYILDRMKREVSPQRLPLSPFVVRENGSELNHLFKRMHFSDETQIDFLKAKIAQRPSDVAEIMKENFDITDRTIAYYPVYLLTFENVKKRREATVSIDGISGEIVLNRITKIPANATSTSREILQPQIADHVVGEAGQIELQFKAISDVFASVRTEKAKVSQKEAPITESQLSQRAVCEEDHEYFSSVSEGNDEATLKENQINVDQTARFGVCCEVGVKPVQDVVLSATESEEGVFQEKNEVIDSKPTEQVVCDKVYADPVPDSVSPVTGGEFENSAKDGQIAKLTRPDRASGLEQQQERIYVLPPGATDSTLNVPKEEQTIQATQSDGNERTILGFPARIYGEVIEINDNVTTVDGDVEIPSGTNIDKNLVVRGSLKIGDNCRGHGKLKASKDITIGAETIIDGDLISGGNIFVGPRSYIKGVVEAAEVFEIEKDAVVEVRARAHTFKL
jgi:hypothetical protein